MEVELGGGGEAQSVHQPVRDWVGLKEGWRGAAEIRHVRSLKGCRLRGGRGKRLSMLTLAWLEMQF